MRRALIIGIDYYDRIAPLHGCVNDAYAVNAMLERNADGSPNFGCKLVTSVAPDSSIERGRLLELVRELFAGDGEIALFYFAGHGSIEETGGYICSSDTQTANDGLSLNDVLTFASQSKFGNRIVVLDSCHSGMMGNPPLRPQTAELQDGMTILTASTAEQYAQEVNGSGAFTTLFVDALGGAAANLIGEVTPGSAYAHVDQSLGAWSQRPMFKTNVRGFVSLRKVRPPIELHDLRRISEIFPAEQFEYPLDPTYEPERSGNEVGIPEPDPEKNAIFSILQQYARVNLVVPNGAPHMWHAAMESRSCRLTALGEHYRRLAAQGRL